MPKLFYHGHASIRLRSNKGVVVYINPYAGDGYGQEADIVLITHAYGEGDPLEKLKQKPACKVITHQEAQSNGVFHTFKIRNVSIRAVSAYSDTLDPRDCVGYIVTMDGLKIYYAGDTAETDTMKEMIFMKLDYALLPVDGEGMGNPIAASICAARIGARHSIPLHAKSGVFYNESTARAFDVPGRLVLQPGQEIEL